MQAALDDGDLLFIQDGFGYRIVIGYRLVIRCGTIVRNRIIVGNRFWRNLMVIKYRHFMLRGDMQRSYGVRRSVY